MGLTSTASGMAALDATVVSQIRDHLHAGTIAVTSAIPPDELWHAVPAFPTVSEIRLHLLEEYGR